MDALSDVLRIANLSGGVFLQAEFAAPWCIAVSVTPQFCGPYVGAATHLMPFHYVVEGELHVGLQGGTAHRLVAGDLVLLPANDTHLMGSDLSLPALPGVDLIAPSQDGGLSIIRHGGPGPQGRVVCGFLGCDAARAKLVVSALPPLMMLRGGETAPAEWIRSTFQYAAREVAAGRAGSATILAKLSELLFVQAVSRYVESLPQDQTGWLAALRDPPIARVLGLMHAEIARPWTVEELARDAGLSRSVLAERFTRLIGATPIHYLAQWRMQVAAHQLKATTESLAQVAQRVGYDSEAGFSRAFKKTFGSAPATWRRIDLAKSPQGAESW